MNAMFPYLVFTVAITLLVAFFFRKSKKTNQGFQFFYYKLSYRRRFLRTLYTFPFAAVVWVALLYFPDWSQQEKIVMSALLLVVFLSQVGYNYYMWKKKDSPNQ